MRFHDYPAGVRLGVLKPKPNCAIHIGLSMTLTKFSICRTAVRIWLFPYVRAQVEAVLQIKLKKDKKDQVLRLVFGDNNIEILNK